MLATRRIHCISGLAMLTVAGLALLATVTLTPTMAVEATDPPDSEWVQTYNRMITEIMSPYCHGLTLDNCPTQGAAELRDEIRAWLKEGRGEEWILDELEMRFGPSILGAPRMRGLGLVAWLTPPLVLLFGTIGVALFLRRHTRSDEESPDGPVAGGLDGQGDKG
jgi:cytochrome c-type biogenesis protein CcmH